MKDMLTVMPSVVAVVLTAIFGFVSYCQSKTQARLAREKDLHAWALQLGGIYSSLHTDEEPERKKSLANLSVLIDYGRLLFPNETSPRALSEHPKGKRSSVLDPLVETYTRCTTDKVVDPMKLQTDWREFTDQLGRKTTAFAIATSPEAEGRKQYKNP